MIYAVAAWNDEISIGARSIWLALGIAMQTVSQEAETFA